MVQNWKNQSVLLLLLVCLSGCTHVETQKSYSMDDLLKLPTEQLFNLKVKDAQKKELNPSSKF